MFITFIYNLFYLYRMYERGYLEIHVELEVVQNGVTRMYVLNY